METKAALKAELVQECVATAHGNLARVQELLAQEPSLVSSSWDWGGGDWETPLGAASHMGRRDIAEFLLANGARLDVFAAAMLGQLPIVQAILHAFPDTLTLRGPHGIPLLDHAKAGGDAATAVLEYLQKDNHR